MRHSFSYKIILPPASIQKYVEHFWFGQVADNSEKKFVHLLTAQKSTQIVFFISGIFSHTSESKSEANKQGDIAIFGQGTINKKIEIISSFSSIFGVKLTPIAIPVIFSLPATEITNLSIKMQELSNKSVNDLVKLIQDSNDCEALANVFTSFILDKIKKNDGNRLSERLFSLTNSAINSIRLSESLGYSERHCERLFLEIIGMNTRQYNRILRFENCISKISKNTNNYTDIALNSGYYDQAHFNHEFKKFSGLTPSQYVSYLNENF